MMQTEFEILTNGPGLTEITSNIRSCVTQSRVETGLLTLFIRHTSASLLIQENADPECCDDLLALESTSEHMWGRVGDTALDSWIFAGDDRLVTDVWSAGRHMVKSGEHVARREIVATYKRTIDALKDAI